MAVTVTLEFTPNPDTLKYTVSRRLLDRGTLDFTQASDAAESPLAQRLFGVDGVRAVMIGRDFVTVTVTGQDVMMDVNTAMLREIKEHLETDQPVYTGEVPEQWFVHGRKNLRPEHTVAQFAGVGVKATQAVAPEALATAMKFELEKGYEYWLGLHNFYVITRYNHSAMYAMCVYELSRRIASQVVAT